MSDKVEGREASSQGRERVGSPKEETICTLASLGIGEPYKIGQFGDFVPKRGKGGGV